MRIEDEIVQKSFPDEYTKLAVNLQFTATYYRNRFRQVLEQYDISPEQFNILRILRGQHPSPAPAKLVADRMIDRSSNVSRLVEKLRTKGLVSRTTCPADRRAVDLVITDDGLGLLERIDQDGESRPSWISGRLNPEEARTLNELLDQMRG